MQKKVLVTPSGVSKLGLKAITPIGGEIYVAVGVTFGAEVALRAEIANVESSIVKGRQGWRV